MKDKNFFLRQLPKVDDMIKLILCEHKIEAPITIIKLAVQNQISNARQKILSDIYYEFSSDELIRCIYDEINMLNKPHLHKVINATGVILHTNLGRAKLSKSVLESLMSIGSSYSNLEYELESGERGSRYSHVENLITFLTGAESALVVNNNAAAVCLVLDTMCKDKEVIVSRGELVEIGGSFRVPEIMKASGCKLVEVGTTNKTHEDDYITNINVNTGAILKVHTSNYKIIGFTEEVSLDKLKNIGETHSLPVIYDLGSGLFFNLEPYGILNEPTVQDCVKEKIDIVCFSGDKLLGGPQAGIIVGSKKYINKMKKNHLLRALRIDKLSLSVLEITLRQYLSPEVYNNIPTLKMITDSLDDLKEKADNFIALLKSREGFDYEIVSTDSQIGGGSLPGVNLSSYAIGVSICGVSSEELERLLRKNLIPIIARIFKDKILLDVRTMEFDEIREVASFFNNFEFERR